MSAPVSEPSRTCAPVINGPAAAVGANFEPPIPPLATPAIAAPRAIIATTMAGDGRRSSRRLSDFLDTSLPPFELPDDLVMNLFERLSDTDTHLRDQPPSRPELAAPEADSERGRCLHVRVDDVRGAHRPAVSAALRVEPLRLNGARLRQRVRCENKLCEDAGAPGRVAGRLDHDPFGRCRHFEHAARERDHARGALRIAHQHERPWIERGPELDRLAELALLDADVTRERPALTVTWLLLSQERLREPADVESHRRCRCPGQHEPSREKMTLVPAGGQLRRFQRD